MKIKARFTALLLAVTFVFAAFYGCTNNNNNNDSEDNSTKTQAPAVDIKIDAQNLNEYVIIRAERASQEIKSAASSFRTKLSNTLGGEMKISEDYVKDPSTLPEKAKEIIIGQSNRRDNNDIVNELRENDYAVIFKNDRIYIIGGSDSATIEAIEYFNQTYVDSEAKMIKVNNQLKDIRYYDYPVKKVEIDGINIRDYTVVIPDDADLYTQYAAENLSDYLQANAGFSLTITTDKTAETDHEILIGETNRAASSVTATIGEGQYILYKNDNKVVCLGDSYMVGGGVGTLVSKIPADSNNIDVNITDLPTTAKAETFTFKKAKSAILMIGDGMGFNSIEVSLPTIGSFSAADLPNQGKSITASLNTQSNPKTPTDSAAGATALSTGYKTYNSYLGVDKNNSIIKNIRELADEKGAMTGVITTDLITGATPGGFLVHHNSRSDTAIIQSQINALLAGNKVDWCSGDIGNNLKSDTVSALRKLSAGDSEFFLMIEEGHIDKYAHKADMANVINMVKRFNDNIAYVIEFVLCHPDTALIITADHETGGITPAGTINDVTALIDDTYENNYRSKISADISKYGYAFTSYYQVASSCCNHSTAEVPVFAIGAGTEYFNGKTVQNIEIPKFIAQIYGTATFGQ